MKKSLRVILVGLLTVVLSMLLTGCGGDNFQGTWITKDPKQTIHVLKIEKNGDNYLVQNTSYWYDIGAGKLVNNAIGDQTHLYDYDVTLTKAVGDKKTATLNKESLVIGPQDIITYIEKDGSLLSDNETFVKLTDNKQLQEAKEKIKSNAEKTVQKREKNTMVKTKINKINFIEDVTLDSGSK